MKVKAIETQEVRERRAKRGKLIGGIVLTAILLLSSIGFAVTIGGDSSNTGSSGSNEEAYFNGQYWVVQKEGSTLYLTQSPDLLGNISVDIQKRAYDYRDAIIFIDSESSQVTNLLASNLGSYTGRIQEACYGPCERDLPEKTCQENLIVWRISEEKKVYQNENCIFIEGDTSAVDAFLYNLFYRR